MMVMPTGPPALIISGLAELGKVSKLEKMAIAKVLSVRIILPRLSVTSLTGNNDRSSMPYRHLFALPSLAP
jgi:hypothetical protein